MVGKKEKIYYKKSIITFDIETTSYIENVKLKNGKEKQMKHAFMYIGAIYNNGVISKYRKWEDFISYFDSLSSLCSKNERYIIWVHNLSFEFQFMKDWIKFSDVFARKAHNVIKCVYKKIEFRDTLALSNCKLEKLAINEKLPVQKATGDLDYSLTRHQSSRLDSVEENYVDLDVIIVAEYIKKKVKEYGSLQEIPMTSTGEVRYLFRKELGKNLKNIHNLSVLYSAQTKELQNLLIDIYAGAYTHANYQIIGKEMYDVLCVDISSSYPYQMVSKKYPTIWLGIKDEKYLVEELFAKYPPEDYAIACRCTFTNLRAKHVHSILSKHKSSRLDLNSLIEDNGRVNSCDVIEFACNEIDILNILDFYDFDNIEIREIYVSKKQYLPKELVSILLKLFQMKTSLKGIEEEVENYMRSKSRISGVYGTCVFNILDSGIYFDNECDTKFIKEEKDFSDFKKYCNNPKQYLWYSIGVWVTSYAKRQILEPIKKLSENALYSDTDSVKYQGYSRYKKMWSHLDAKYKTQFYDAMRYHNFKKEQYEFYDKNGKQYFMGVFEKEPTYKRFKALGSKRYLVEYENGKMSSTVAGAPKDLVNHLGKTNDEKFKNFSNYFTLKNCKLCHTYTEEDTYRIITDYEGKSDIVHIKSGVCLMPADFSMNWSDTFIEFLLGKIELEDKDIYRYFIGQKHFK